MAGNISISGFRQLRNNINRLNTGMQRRVYKKAAKAGGKLILARARQAAPSNTGTLRKSLVIRASSKPSAGYFGVKVSVKGGLSASDRTARRRGVGATYKPDSVERYYRFVETGTKYHAAQPFLEPAITANPGAILSAVKAVLAAGIGRESGRLPRS